MTRIIKRLASLLRPGPLLTAVLCLSSFGAPVPCAGAESDKFSIGDKDFLLNDQPFLIRCGELHFARIPREYWQHRLRMCRAMGLNTVCAYLFWNLHEPQPGRWNWSGSADAAEFCRIAHAEGLKVILRPGPYSCAEWDFGGFPYWLLKTPDLKVRTQDTRYLEAAKRYLLQVGAQLAPLQATRGGPIIMVQVENEYGSYGSDKEYIRTLAGYLKEAGFTVPLFTCDGPVQLKNDTVPELFCVVNFGSNPEQNFKPLREIRPTGPLMCGEYYPGWFDSWGKAHHFGDTMRIVKEVGWMLEQNASFSIYMAHGGTSYGFTAGANCPPFSPQITSYDYDAPISEAGWETTKFTALRELFLKHLSPGEKLPDVPPRNPVISFPPITLTDCALMFGNFPPAHSVEKPICMEMLNQANGVVVYRTSIPPGAGERLVITELHDYGLVFLNKQKIATLDRRRNQNSVTLPKREQEMTLDIVVDTFGHVNYGGYIHDRKGITQKVELNTPGGPRELTNWEVYSMPQQPRDLGLLQFLQTTTEQPAYFRGHFELTRTGDTFLDLRGWAKGVVWVNGHNLGRYWNIGPQQTLYCPGPWLKAGRNEIIVFELNGTTNHVVAGLPEPILNEVKETVLAKNRKPGQAPRLADLQPAATGTFAPGKDWQTVKITTTPGRYFILEALNNHTGDSFTTCAELYLVGSDGKDLPRDGWKVLYADSEETGDDDGRADNLFDLQFTTFWHTEWAGKQPPHPHFVIIDLGSEQSIAGMRQLPRQDSANGRIKDWRVYVTPTPPPGL